MLIFRQDQQVFFFCLKKIFLALKKKNAEATNSTYQKPYQPSSLSTKPLITSALPSPLCGSQDMEVVGLCTTLMLRPKTSATSTAPHESSSLVYHLHLHNT